MPQSATYLAQFARDGKVDFGATYVERRGRAAVVNLRNAKYLNAEDDGTVLAQELAVDLCTLDEISQIAVMRGAPIDSGKYQGRRVFCTGINLTHLYYGKVPFLWYLQREMGFINKIFRGTASPDCSPDEILGQTREKMWIAAVDAFAIGGGCQYLLAMDVNIAASDAYLTLPARKEGIIPGAANLRLPRFVGDRVARQLIMMERRLECDSDVGRMICDLVVAPDQVDQAIDDTVQSITSSGVVSASCNRKSFRVAHEPLDLFRRYVAVYAREQAFCHFSPALIGNLERHWNAQNRKV
jgi:(3,5-dihydroxyphenyl)acetyl-CoA 1,2-dioxygenase